MYFKKNNHHNQLVPWIQKRNRPMNQNKELAPRLEASNTMPLVLKDFYLVKNQVVYQDNLPLNIKHNQSSIKQLVKTISTIQKY